MPREVRSRGSEGRFRGGEFDGRKVGGGIVRWKVCVWRGGGDGVWSGEKSSREEESCNAISGGSFTFKIPRDQSSPYS